VTHVLLQRARLVDGEVFGSWAVSINAIETLLWAVAEESPVLSDIGTFGAVLRCSVARLAADVAADIIRRAAALIGRVR